MEREGVASKTGESDFEGRETGTTEVRLANGLKVSLMEHEPNGHHERLAAISREVVGLLKDLVGRGPTKSKVYIHDDCVLLLLREGHTRGEETMFAAGGARGVAQGRVDISETIRAPLIEVIERHTGREVVGFLPSSQQHPDLISFVFVLDTSPLLEVIKGDREASG
jgi:uncharacterized protein YbcI